jgi:uncharacterized protein
VDRLFLDANILFSASYNPTSSLRNLWTVSNTELIASPFAIQEAQTNLAQSKPRQLGDLSALLASVRIVADPLPGSALPAGITLPEKDVPILLAAMAAQATHLLTGDVKHFGKYFGFSFGGVLILRPGVYLLSRQGKP